MIAINKPGLKELNCNALLKLRYRNGWHCSGILKVSSIARWKSRKGIMFLIDLESIQHKLSSDYSLDICFSRRFPYIHGPSFSPYKPLQNVDFSKVGNMQFFSGIVLTIDKNSGKKVWGYVSRQNSKWGNLLKSRLRYRATYLCCFYIYHSLIFSFIY